MLVLVRIGRSVGSAAREQQIYAVRSIVTDLTTGEPVIVLEADAVGIPYAALEHGWRP